MSANKKRRKLPEEDLAAAVAEIINSPITRSNLSFLRPLAVPPSTEEPSDQKPVGVAPEPMGLDATPMGDAVKPMGVEAPVIPSPPPIPVGVDVTPMGLDPSPTGLPRTPAATSAESGRTLWQAEGIGSIIEQARIRRIVQAQDALSLVEEKVYDLLWGPKNQRKDEFRLVHYSLQRIAAEARVNIKTVRELIPRLLEKGFIDIEHVADAHRNIPTLYRVWGYTAVLNDQKRRRRLYVAKTGKGVVYVHPVEVEMASQEPRKSRKNPWVLGQDPEGLRPMGLESKPMGVRPMGPMGLDVSKPMGLAGTPSLLGIYIDNKTVQTTTTSTTTAALVGCIQAALTLEPDTTLLDGMIEACHRNAIETTGEPASEEELLYFTSSKARVIARAPNIRNHLAVLRKAVPECFLGESFRAYRAAAAIRRQKLNEEEQRIASERAERQREAAETEARHVLWARISEQHHDEQGYDLQAIAKDPELDEPGRQQARRLMERLGRYAKSGL